MGIMRFYQLKNWISQQFKNTKLNVIFIWYLLSIMIETRKHSLEFASAISKLDKSRFSRFLKNNKGILACTLDELSKKQAKIFSKILKKIDSLPWCVAIIFDSTMQNRSSLHPKNAKRFNHGQGFKIGHQWTNIILIVNGYIIPLPPIPFYSKKYCLENKIPYQSEHKRLVEYINNLNLEQYIGGHIPSEIVALADSGYDDKEIQNTIISKGWNFIIALKSNRSVKSASANIRKSESDWNNVCNFFKNQRRLKWETIRITRDSHNKKRMEFRIRHTNVLLKEVKEIQLVCSEFKKNPKGKRKYLACSDLKVKPRQILIGYRLRWKIEIFHKHIKMHLGFEDIAAKHFSSVESHVYMVYCAYILLQAKPPGVSDDSKDILDKQRDILAVIENKEKASTLQELTRIGGVEKFKNKLKEALMIP